jgi:hypothetical protein
MSTFEGLWRATYEAKGFEEASSRRQTVGTVLIRPDVGFSWNDRGQSAFHTGLMLERSKRLDAGSTEVNGQAYGRFYRTW